MSICVVLSLNNNKCSTPTAPFMSVMGATQNIMFFFFRAVLRENYTDVPNKMAPVIVQYIQYNRKQLDLFYSV